MNRKVYIRIDVDNAGDEIELALMNSDYKKAQSVHYKIQENINLVLNKIKVNDSIVILMTGCDDILFSIEKKDYELQFLEKLKKDFLSNSGFSLSIGVGNSIKECMLNLRIAKISGKDKIIESITDKFN